MSSIYNPNGTIPAPSVAGQQRFPILSSTNSAPIQVTIATPVAWSDQDTIAIENHQTNTNANGMWVVTKISSTIFLLNGSTGNGVGGATGTGQDYSLTPVLTVMGDGDALTAPNLNPAIEGTANIGPFLYQMSGKYRLYDIYSVQFGDQASSIPVYGATTTSSTTFVNASGLTGLLSGLFPAGSWPALQSNDILQYTAFWQFQMTTFGGGTVGCYTTLGMNKNGGSYTQVAGSTSAYSPDEGSALDGPVYPISAMIDGYVNPGVSRIFDFSVMVRSPSGSSMGMHFFGGASLRVNHYRLNG